MSRTTSPEPPAALAGVAEFAADLRARVDLLHRLAVRSEVDQLRRAAAALPDERQRYIVVRRFGLEDDVARSVADVGEELGLSRERVSQLEQRAFAWLREHGLFDGPPPGTASPRANRPAEVALDLVLRVGVASARTDPREALSLARAVERIAERIRVEVAGQASAPGSPYGIPELLAFYDELAAAGADSADDLLAPIVERAARQGYVELISREPFSSSFDWSLYPTDQVLSLLVAAAADGVPALGLGAIGGEEAERLLCWLREAGNDALPDPVERIVWLGERTQGLDALGTHREAVSDLIASWIREVAQTMDPVEAVRARAAVARFWAGRLDEYVTESALGDLEDVRRR